MKRLLKYLILICLTAAVSLADGQTGGLYNSSLNHTSNNIYGKIIGEIYYLTPGANANYFLHKEWVNGTLVFRSGEVFNNIDLRYNAFQDELIGFNKNINTLLIIEKEKVKEFTLNFSSLDAGMPDMNFVNIDSVSTQVNTNYFECLYSGNVMLLISNRIAELKVSPYNDSSGKLRDTEFVRRKSNFIYSPEKGLSKIRFSNQSVANVYPEKKKEIKKTLRQNKLRISNAKSAADAIEMLDKKGLLK